MNLRKTALLTLSLLIVVVPAFASAAADEKEQPKVAQSYWAKALGYGTTLLQSAKNRWYVTAPVVAAAATGVAYKASPKVKAQIDAGLTAAQTKVKSTYTAVSKKLEAWDNKPFSRADAIKISGAALITYGLYTSRDKITDMLLGAYPKAGAGDIDAERAKRVRVGGLKGQIVKGYNYLVDSSAGQYIAKQSTTVKVAMVAGTAVLAAGAVKAYQYFTNNKKAATPVAKPAPAAAASASASASAAK